jgi:hypothetical protein
MSIAVSCVVDDAPRFHRQALRFAASLAAVDREGVLTVIVHHVGRLPPEVRQALVRRGVLLREVVSFGSGPAAYCNKLQQFESLLELGARRLVLCDADLFFLESPRALFEGDAVAAHVVDRANPGDAMLARLLGGAGFDAEPLDTQPRFEPDALTHRLNCNGGLYAMRREHLQVLAPAWRRRATACLGQPALLGDKLMHADQLGFMLAMLETRLPFAPLPDGANYPTHFSPGTYTAVPERLSSLHYHQRVRPDDSLSVTGNIALDAWIAIANGILRAEGVAGEAHATRRDVAQAATTE